MLKEAQIENFQPHRSTTLKFSKGITGIIGDSLSGKTAILRAIKWAIENRPRGFSFHSDFAKEKDPTSTKLIFDNCKIKLSKTKGSSTYTIEEDNKTKSFNKLKTKVPDIIKNKTNLSSINFQNQLDAHFLITSSGGKIAKTISHITQTDKIISWIQEITRNISTLKTSKAVLKKDIEEINSKLIPFKKLQDLDIILSKIEDLQCKKEKIDLKYYRIEDLLLQIEKVRKEIRRKESYLGAKPYIKKIESLEQQLRAFKKQKEALIETLNIQKTIKEEEENKTSLIRLYIEKIKKNRLCPICFGAITSRTIKQIEKEMKT